MTLQISDLYKIVPEQSEGIYYIIKGCSELGIDKDISELFLFRDIVIKHVAFDKPDIQYDIEYIFNVPEIQEYLNAPPNDDDDDDDGICGCPYRENETICTVTFNPLVCFMMIVTTVLSGANFVMMLQRTSQCQ